ncbi:MAG: hypothetical protein CSB34_05290 [Desulfobulbus propionicus]|nr:MAG: hypothetical protein CSB34_05290 [Desulfobulbus propionicus]
MEAEIVEAFGSQAAVELIAGSNGIFDVTVDGEVLYSKKQAKGRFPHPGEVVQLLNNR